MTAARHRLAIRRDIALVDAARRLVRVAAIAAALLAGSSIHAERADRDKPMQVESDRMAYDDLKQVNEFSGRVLLTKGTITIRGDRIVLRQDPAGFQYAVATGAPATFRQKREAADEWIEGEALQLEYDTRTEVVRLKEKSTLRKLSGTRVTDEVFGREIVYESLKEFFTVEGGPGAVTPENPQGRVRVVIQPKRPADGAAANPVPAKPAPLKPERALPAAPARAN